MKTFAVSLLTACLIFGPQLKGSEPPPYLVRNKLSLPVLRAAPVPALLQTEVAVEDAPPDLQLPEGIENAGKIATDPARTDLSESLHCKAPVQSVPADVNDTHPAERFTAADLSALQETITETASEVNFPVEVTPVEAAYAPGPEAHPGAASGESAASIASVKEVAANTNKNRYYLSAFAASRLQEAGADTYTTAEILSKAIELKHFAEEHGYATDYAFVVNMGLRSGRKRFFVVDLFSMSIINSGVVTHGRGETNFTLNKKYSNKPGSRCTSLGMYKIGMYYRGMFGPSFKLHGLEKTNSNAYRRSIVLHPMNSIPYEEIDFPIVQTEGCPSVAPQFLQEIKPLITRSAKPVLLYLFDNDHSLTAAAR